LTIRISHPHLPDRRRLDKYLDRIFSSRWLTNSGPLVQELEERLSGYLNVPNLLLVANGTLALQVAYRVLEVTTAALTTPFSFVATASSLAWERIDPLFVDIDAATLNLDPDLLSHSPVHEATAVVPVHVYGNPCATAAIDSFASAHDLKVIYDGAHAFGVSHLDQGIGRFGDATTYSFHATKLFHTIEGGAIAFADEAAHEEAKETINFGIQGEDVSGKPGINAKMHEFEAAMGLALLDEIDEIMSSRRLVHDAYMEQLEGPVSYPERTTGATQNYAYFPILLENESTTVAVGEALSHIGVASRRYFRPSLDTLEYVGGPAMKRARSAADRVLCLPIHTAMSRSDAIRIANAVNAVVA
jgi:dTDP-4-amino-4,6-dideoxygalactose transaminase